MKLTIPQDFQAIDEFPAHALEQFENQVSEEIREFWIRAGLGSFSSGFMRAIDPLQVYDELQGKTEIKLALGEDFKLIPVFASVFGDLVAYDGAGTYYGVNFHHRRIAEVGVRLPFLLQDLQSGFFHREMFSPEGYSEAREALGEPALTECYAASPQGVTLALLSDFVSNSSGDFILA